MFRIDEKVYSVDELFFNLDLIPLKFTKRARISFLVDTTVFYESNKFMKVLKKIILSLCYLNYSLPILIIEINKKKITHNK